MGGRQKPEARGGYIEIASEKESPLTPNAALDASEEQEAEKAPSGGRGSRRRVEEHPFSAMLPTERPDENRVSIKMRFAMYSGNTLQCLPMPLEPEEQRHLTAAHGFLELGMPLEANAELERIDPYVRHVPEVLAVRVEIYRALEKWELMSTVTKKLAEYDPISPKWALLLAYALRRAESIESARQILLTVAERFPSVAVVHYNLACYECQLRNYHAAKERLKTAFKIDPALRAQALEDADLENLWSGM